MTTETNRDDQREPPDRRSAAIGELYDRRGAQAFSIARAAVGSDAGAGAVVEAAFAHLMRIWRGLDPEADLDRLLLLLVRNALNSRSSDRMPRPSGPPARNPVPVPALGLAGILARRLSAGA